MRRFFVSLFLCVAFSAMAQNTNVTGTITDSDGIVWANGTWSASLYNPSGTQRPVYCNTGQPVQTDFQNQTLSNLGVLTATLPDNNLVCPSGTRWIFTIQSDTSAVPSVLPPALISGASQNISTFLSTGVTAPRFIGDGLAFGYSSLEVSPVTNGSQFKNTTDGNFYFYSCSSSGTCSWSVVTCDASPDVPHSPKCFGAPSDGLSHPLSSKYATIAAALVDFPNAQSAQAVGNASASTSLALTFIQDGYIRNGDLITNPPAGVPPGTTVVSGGPLTGSGTVVVSNPVTITNAALTFASLTEELDLAAFQKASATFCPYPLGPYGAGFMWLVTPARYMFSSTWHMNNDVTCTVHVDGGGNGNPTGGVFLWNGPPSVGHDDNPMFLLSLSQGSVLENFTQVGGASGTNVPNGIELYNPPAFTSPKAGGGSQVMTMNTFRNLFCGTTPGITLHAIQYCFDYAGVAGNNDQNQFERLYWHDPTIGMFNVADQSVLNQINGVTVFNASVAAFLINNNALQINNCEFANDQKDLLFSSGAAYHLYGVNNPNYAGGGTYAQGANKVTIGSCGSEGGGQLINSGDSTLLQVEVHNLTASSAAVHNAIGTGTISSGTASLALTGVTGTLNNGDHVTSSASGVPGGTTILSGGPVTGSGTVTLSANATLTITAKPFTFSDCSFIDVAPSYTSGGSTASVSLYDTAITGAGNGCANSTVHLGPNAAVGASKVFHAIRTQSITCAEIQYAVLDSPSSFVDVHVEDSSGGQQCDIKIGSGNANQTIADKQNAQEGSGKNFIKSGNVSYTLSGDYNNSTDFFIDTQKGNSSFQTTAHRWDWNITGVEAQPDTGSGSTLCLKKQIAAGAPTNVMCFDRTTGTVTFSTPVVLPVGSHPWTCVDGLDSSAALTTSGWPLVGTCYNSTGSTVTISSIRCYNDAGSTTVLTTQLTNGAGTSLLSGTMTCSNSWGNGSQSGTTTIANGDYIKWAVTPDGTSQAFTLQLTGTY
jgi:hypothetical protein